MLVQVSAGANSNKFYEAILDQDGTVYKRWGRVGADGQRQTERSGKAGFDRLIASKKRRGYTEVELTDTPKARVGADLTRIAQRRVPQDPADTGLAKLIADWCAANRHHIATVSGGKITVADSGAVTTALGAVSSATIDQARAFLNDITAKPGTDRTGLVESYLTLIPQDIGRRAGWVDTFVDPSELVRQADFLDALSGSVAMAASVAGGSDGDDGPDAEFRYQLVRVDPDSRKFAEIAKRFNGSKNGRHTSSALKLKALFAIVPTRPAEPKTWKGLADANGNVKRLWHGTQQSNLISILHRGLYVPPSSGSSVQVTGRMFGDGIYFSDQSTKSLNYSQGYWNRTHSDHCFMFSADVVMGNELRPSARTSAELRRYDGKAFHSINVKGGTCGVVNNEMIQRDTAAIKLAYLCEFDR